MQGNDALAQYQIDIHQPRVSRPDLVPHLAVYALRHIPNSHHVIRKHVTTNTVAVTQIKPLPYNNDGKMQMMHH